MEVIHPGLSKCHIPALFICITSKATGKWECIDLVAALQGTCAVDTADSIRVKAVANPLSVTRQQMLQQLRTSPPTA